MSQLNQRLGEKGANLSFQAFCFSQASNGWDDVHPLGNYAPKYQNCQEYFS